MLTFLTLRVLLLIGAGAAMYYAYKLIVKEYYLEKQQIKDMKRAIVVASREDYRGYISTADLAFNMELTFEQAENLIAAMMKRGLATIDVDKTGSEEILYHIPKAEKLYEDTDRDREIEQLSSFSQSRRLGDKYYTKE